MFLWAILQLRKGTNVTILHQRNSMSLNEQEPYFTNTYLQGENSPSEDKKEFLLDVSSILVSHTPHCSSCSNYVPKNPYDSVLEHMPETPNEPPMPEMPNEP